MPLQPKIDLLLQINEEALKVKDASFVSAFMLFVNEKKFFASTDGSYITQSLIRSYPTFSVTSVDRDDQPLLPAQRADRRRWAMGYEYIESLPLLAGGQGRRPKKRSRCTRPSPPCPGRRR